ncbi:hypothetical protein JRQ81_004583, partial [Phrynocephalus forsythii]
PPPGTMKKALQRLGALVGLIGSVSLGVSLLRLQRGPPGPAAASASASASSRRGLLLRGILGLSDGALTFRLSPGAFEDLLPHLQRYRCRARVAPPPALRPPGPPRRLRLSPAAPAAAHPVPPGGERPEGGPAPHVGPSRAGGGRLPAPAALPDGHQQQPGPPGPPACPAPRAPPSPTSSWGTSRSRTRTSRSRSAASSGGRAGTARTRAQHVFQGEPGGRATSEPAREGRARVLGHRQRGRAAVWLFPLSLRQRTLDKTGHLPLS